MVSPVLERFLRYVTIPTASDPEAVGMVPSTPEQKAFAEVLRKELLELGLHEVDISPQGYLTASFPATDPKAPTIGFLTHMDTSPEVSGKEITPRIVTNYDGGDILLNPEENVILSPKDFPELLLYEGQDLVVTDGTTLLGADDKSGIAAVMTFLEELTQLPPFPHGKIKVAFTPDEEIGRGADHFDIPGFGADFAYTVDGGEIGELQYENFNAATLKVHITGRNTHPGTAKGKMVNALTLGRLFQNLLPQEEVPELTEGYEGFFHLISFEGTVEEAQCTYILRDFSVSGLERRKQLANQAADNLNNAYGKRVVLEITDSYKNMKEKVETHYEIITLAEKAMQACGIAPKIIPIRGGSDGARLSWEGLLTPNFFAGGHNFHSRYEYLPVPSMEACVKVLHKIVELGKDMPSLKAGR